MGHGLSEHWGAGWARMDLHGLLEHVAYELLMSCCQVERELVVARSEGIAKEGNPGDLLSVYNVHVV